MKEAKPGDSVILQHGNEMRGPFLVTNANDHALFLADGFRWITREGNVYPAAWSAWKPILIPKRR